MEEAASKEPLKGLEDAFAGLGIESMGTVRPGAKPEEVMRRRRAFFRREESPFAHLSLVRGPDGVLRWHDEAPGVMAPSVGRRAGRAAVPAGRIEQQFVFEKLHEPSKVTEALVELDAKLTDPGRRDLWRWTENGWEKFPPDQEGALAGKNILLFIHGTFSHCDKLFDDLLGTADGRAFLGHALKDYHLVLAFNHPTLGASPAVNAFTLAAHLRDRKGPPRAVDVICHSRGGLVTRWWLEGFADPRTKYRAVFVASPLGGTSLAAPPRLKGALDYLTNVANVLGWGAGASGVPVIQFVGGLIKILTSVARVAIHSPALDAAVAAIPGLAAQSRVGNNVELRAVRAAGAGRNQTYFAIRSDFRPPAVERWKFWNLFCNPKAYGLAWADKGVDLIFVQRQSEKHEWELAPNDLVVDCASMRELDDGNPDGGIPPGLIKKTFDFDETSGVMHTEYFQKKETMGFIAQVLTPLPKK